MKFIPNSARRPCTDCGIIVRSGEGRLSRKSKSGEWLVKHDGECPSSAPSAIVVEDTVETLHPNVERLTPVDGNRIYRITGQGDHVSVTSALDGLENFEAGPKLLSEWERVEAGHAGIQNLDVYESDYNAWKGLVKGAGETVANEASVFGTAVHDSIEDVIRCRLDKTVPDFEAIVQSHVHSEEHMREQYLDRVGRSVESFLKWESSWVASWYGAELIVWHTGEKWAGAVDAYGAIAKAELKGHVWGPSDTAVPSFIDWKTSRPKKADWQEKPGKLSKQGYRLQIAGAYARAEYTFNNQGELTAFADRKPIEQALIAHVGIEDVQIEAIMAGEFSKYGEAFRKVQEIKSSMNDLQTLLSD